MKKLLLLKVFLYLTIVSFSQVFTLGNSLTSNSSTTYPAPYGNYYEGAKHQMIVRASELNSLGMTVGNINSLAFDVETTNGIALVDFSIAMKQTTIANWNFSSDDFETGLTTVYTNNAYTEISGWNTHTFSSPFYWDGISNLIIETCFNNTSYTNNASTYYSSTSYTSVLYTRRDQSGVCSTIQNNSNFFGSTNRPNIRFEWQAPNVPPVTEFNVSSTSSCSPQISFFDQSSGNPTSWFWDFGDGNTSTLENPTHVYNASGTYSISLTSTNQFGSNTETKTNYIIINLSGIGPVPASCIPLTQDGSLGFGITNVNFNTINEATGNASEGYTDKTCSQTTVFAGQTYPISIEHSTPAFHNCAVWIDYNNNGVFEDLTEKVITNSSSLTTVGNITISSFAVLNTPLRMRVIADYDLNASPTACANPTYGQAEDYTIYVTLDPNPPIADFIVNVTTSCDGEVQFSDLSTNVPTSWFWDFGDGNNSIQQNPTHNYSVNGTYTVSLIVTNQFGSNTLTQTNLITINFSNQLAATQCAPQTLSHCCGYGIYKVKFNTNGFENFSVGAEEGYQDYSCIYNDSVEGGSPYPFEVRTGSNNPQDTRVWIDYDNNGIFENSEIVFEALNDYNPSGLINIPSNGIQWNTPLRFRVLSDEVGSTLSSCNNLIRGQVEDYFLIISEPIIPPVASFESDITRTCDGVVNFTDLSLNAISSWLWDFGDGNTSTLQNPTHIYLTSGLYTVSLTVSGQFGSDTETKVNYISVDTDFNIVSAQCQPQTQSYCCDYGIQRFQFDFWSSGPFSNWTINNISANASEGYKDFSCEINHTILGGNNYSVAIDTWNVLQDKKIWIDFNNDGSFDNSELVFEAFNEIFSDGTIAIPSSGVTWGTSLRMRVLVDEVGASLTSCGDPIKGQVEDYALTILEPNGTDVLENKKILTTLYPNPAKHFFKISTEENSTTKVDVYSVAGEKVISQSQFTNQNEIEIQTDNLSQGTYFVEVALSNGKVEVHKLILIK